MSSTPNTLSCNADYSSGRVGKQQMTKENISLFGAQLAGFQSPKVLDMSAARGHFLQYAESHLGAQKLVGIEPDIELLAGVQLGSQTQIISKDFREISLDEKFSIIYSCHTLEHYADPIPNLAFIANHLALGGRAIIDVPNLESLLDLPPIDEFFYDKHRSYFTRSTLHQALQQVGLTVFGDASTRASIKFYVGKCESIAENKLEFPSQGLNSRRLIFEYGAQLIKNRATLPHAVELLCGRVANWEESVVIGCGRILDAAVRYGHFPVGKVTYLVDNFLATAGAHAFGRQIITLEQVPRLRAPDAILMTRTATESLNDSIRMWNSASRIQTLSQVIEHPR